MVVQLRPASTVVLLRTVHDRVEVFLVRRHDNLAFMGGAHVFPGGRLDEADYASAGVCQTNADELARMHDVDAALAQAFHVAAIRELFEEAGVLLAHDGSGRMAEIATADAPRFGEYRVALANNRLTLAEIGERERLTLACDALAYFAHWVTPEVETRRFDTRFFVTVAPENQDATHDEHELTHGEWIRPSAAIERCRQGEIALPPPTWTTLRLLERFATVEMVMAWARDQHVPRVQPHLTANGDTKQITLPGDPSYPAIAGFEASETRFVLTNGRWQPDK